MLRIRSYRRRFSLLVVTAVIVAIVLVGAGVAVLAPWEYYSDFPSGCIGNMRAGSTDEEGLLRYSWVGTAEEFERCISEIESYLGAETVDFSKLEDDGSLDPVSYQFSIRPPEGYLPEGLPAFPADWMEGMHGAIFIPADVYREDAVVDPECAEFWVVIDDVPSDDYPPDVDPDEWVPLGWTGPEEEFERCKDRYLQ